MQRQMGLDKGILRWGEGRWLCPPGSHGASGEGGREHLGCSSLRVAPCPLSPSAGAARLHTLLQDLGLSLGASDAERVQSVCVAVCTRAAQLCAAALAAVLTRLQHSREQQTLQIAVATGGRVFERHPRYWQSTRSCLSREHVRLCQTPRGHAGTQVQGTEYEWHPSRARLDGVWDQKKSERKDAFLGCAREGSLGHWACDWCTDRFRTEVIRARCQARVRLACVCVGSSVSCRRR